MRLRDRVAVLVSPHGEHLGVSAVVDPRVTMSDDDAFALHFACTLLGYELSHRRSLVELEEGVRRDLFDDLLGGALHPPQHAALPAGTHRRTHPLRPA